MPEGLFSVSVLSPESSLLGTEARAVVLRSSDGDLTVLDGHTPLVTDVLPGEVRVDPAEGDPMRLAVHGGYLQVETGPGIGDDGGRGTRVTLLAGVAERAETIDVARAERARAEAQARVDELRAQGRGATGPPGTGGESEATVHDAELVAAEAALRRAEVRLEVAGPR